MNILYVIPARGGSKGIPYKNIKPLAGKPLICYSIDVARKLTSDENICVSTDDQKIIEVVESYGLKVPFTRPAHLATDEATTNDVLLHAVDFYEQKGIKYDVLVLLQPTSPLRTVEHVQETLAIYTDDIDMVVSVKKSHAANVLCQDDEKGYLQFNFNTKGVQRQKMEEFFEYNGAIYVINIKSLKEKGISNFTKKKKNIMSEESSIDIDTPLDFLITEFILNQYV